jgi:hypothetical protein
MTHTCVVKPMADAGIDVSFADAPVDALDDAMDDAAADAEVDAP